MRTVSQKFDDLIAPISDSDLRVSAGREDQIGEFYYLKTDDLLPYPGQARKSFDPLKIEELAQTISLYGIRQPLTVEKAHNQIGKYYVVSGERRLRAAHLINLEKVPCIILNDGDSAEEIALIENIQRMDLHPLELAACYEKMLENGKHGDKKNLSERIGVSPTTVSEHLKYNKLPESVKSVLIENNISSRSILRRLLKCSDEPSMMRMLGIKNASQIVEKKKNIFHAYIKGGQVHFDSKIEGLSSESKNKLIHKLDSFIKELKE